MNSPLIMSDPSGLQAASNPDEDVPFYDPPSISQAFESFLEYFNFFRGDIKENHKQSFSPIKAVTSASTPGSTTRSSFAPFGSLEDVKRFEDGINTIDLTGLFNLQNKSYKRSIGQASDGEVALAAVDFGSNFIGFGGTARKKAVEETGEGLLRVGRWMEIDELTKMTKTGMVQESKSGTTHAVFPANVLGFMNETSSKRVYVEFDVPGSSVKVTNAARDWVKILTPNSLEGRNAARLGRPVPQTPPAKNIFCYACRTKIP